MIYLIVSFAHITSSVLYSCNSEDNVDSRVGINESTDLSNLKGESSLFESLLHLTGAEIAEVSSLSGRTALRDLTCDALEVFH
ncbi:hypothetical protein FGO68_gene7577 [Halteria grandinella]|uniref:Uncharacterized protein n=1 Tax=Halteria grandinella TaxID=5974 RepID=A0A8J8NBJ7_HALGN|nr:hypothetical protein FGO68_gene7577 [Halteria grandinella]